MTDRKSRQQEEMRRTMERFHRNNHCEDEARRFGVVYGRTRICDGDTIELRNYEYGTGCNSPRRFLTRGRIICASPSPLRLTAHQAIKLGKLLIATATLVQSMPIQQHKNAIKNLRQELRNQGG